MYNESLDVLEHHIKPLRRVPGVVLEQSYLNKMADGLKPLESLAISSQKINIAMLTSSRCKSNIYVSLSVTLIAGEKIYHVFNKFYA
jgi:hypothetical protein